MLSIKSILLTATSLLAVATAAPAAAPYQYRLLVTFGGYFDGCLESDGKYVQTSSCSPLFVRTASGSGYTLTTPSGPCGIVADRLHCGPSVTPAVFSTFREGLGLNDIGFTADTPGGYLLHKTDTSHGNFGTLVLFDGILGN